MIKRKITSKLLKIVSLMLTVIMVLGMTSTFVSAETVSIGSKDETPGYITVGGIEQSATAVAYRLMTVDFDYSAGQPNDPEFYWVDNAKLKAFVNEKYRGIVNSDGSVNMSMMDGIKDSPDKRVTFFDQIAAAIRSGRIDLNESGSVEGNGRIDSLEMGGYLVLIEGGERVYRASAVNVVPLHSEGKWVVDCPTIQVKSSETQIQKKILTAAGNSFDKYVASIGDTVKFEIITKVPDYPANAIHKTYTVGDNPANGFTLKQETIKVYNADNNGTELLDNINDKYYTINVKGNNFEITFKYDEIKGYKNLLVKYDALLNNGAVIGGDGNENDAFLTYSNNPYGTTDSVKKYNDSAIIYTYGFDLTKVDKTNHEKTLTGAEFTLYSDEDLTKSIAFAGTDGSYIKSDGTEGGTVTTVKVDENGKLILKGLKPGTYYLKETKAPDKYNIQRDPFQLIIGNGNDYVATDRNNGKFPNGLIIKNIENSNGFALPTTGDMGTILFAAGGVALVALGAVLVIVARRRSKNTDAA